MRIIGYSERGAVNSLLYEISYSQSPVRILSDLVSLVHFPFGKSNITGLLEATVLVEQSLSDFGDADAIILLRTEKGPMALFLEAKVKPSQTNEWHIKEEFRQFVAGTASKVNSSNLFTQLYHKVRFVNGLKRGGIFELEHGLSFPSSSRRSKRKIGRNAVVSRAVQKIQPFLEQVRYIALVPDHTDSVNEFFITTLKTFSPPEYDEWNIDEYGFLCWSEIEDFCQVQRLHNTIKVLDFNRGQVY